MQCGYGDELFQAWNSGKIRQKDLPEKGGGSMTLDRCERWRAEHERCSRRVHAAQRLPRDRSPSRSRSRSRSPNSRRSSVSGSDQRCEAEGLKIPHTKIVQGGDTCPPNPISSQSLTVLFIYLFSGIKNTDIDSPKATTHD